MTKVSTTKGEDMSHLGRLGVARREGPRILVEFSMGRKIKSFSYDPEINIILKCRQLGRRVSKSRIRREKIFNPSSQVCTSECRRCF